MLVMAQKAGEVVEGVFAVKARRVNQRHEDVTNPGSVGGAGVALALQILNGQAPAEQTVKLTPAIWDNATEEGKAALVAAADPALDPGWPVGISIADWTTYTKEQLLACKGPGEA